MPGDGGGVQVQGGLHERGIWTLRGEKEKSVNICELLLIYYLHIFTEEIYS
jgi:hypothetical protein